MMTLQTTLSLQFISKDFTQGTHTFSVLKNISTRFDSGCTYALTGVSGTGKSTLLNIIAGIESVTAGKVIVNGTDIHSVSCTEKQKLLLRTLGLIFQSPYLLSELSILENIMLKALLNKKDIIKAKSRALELLKHIGLLDKAHQPPTLLSGGEQQRVAIARALCIQPAFLLADEPTAHLDEYNREIVLKLFNYCAQEWQMGIIVASHDPVVSASMNTVLEIKHGQLLKK